MRVALAAFVIAACCHWPASAEIRQATGRISSLRVHEVGTKFGPPNDSIDVEVVIRLDSQPNRAFGFQLRGGPALPAHEGMLDICRDAFNNGWTITIDFDVQPPRLNALLIRATITRPQLVTISERPNVVVASEDPAGAGKLDPAVLDSAPPPPPEEVGKGGHALMDKTRWSPIEQFKLASGGSRGITVSIDKPSLILAHASWNGASVPPSLRIVRGGSVLASGDASPVPPNRGVVVTNTQVNASGNVVVTVENRGTAATAIQLAVGVLPLEP